jgi:hypothetical protein
MLGQHTGPRHVGPRHSIVGPRRWTKTLGQGERWCAADHVLTNLDVYMVDWYINNMIIMIAMAMMVRWCTCMGATHS